MKAFHFISEKYALDVISYQRLKVSLLNDLNDPFELNAVDLPDRESRKKAYNFKQFMAERYGMLCFCKIWKNPLLWSHYANRHKGVALEFEIKDDIAFTIKYRKERYVLNAGKSYSVNKKFERKDIEGIWLTKFRDWSYEKEIRVIVEKSECQKNDKKYYYNLDSDIQLHGLILGPLCEITPEMIEKKMPPNKKMTVMKSRLAFRSFNIVTQKEFKKRMLSGKSI
jgi:hypothetical protein